MLTHQPPREDRGGQSRGAAAHDGDVGEPGSGLNNGVRDNRVGHETPIMPRYDYSCPANNFVVEVRHSVNERLKTWGELCERALILPDGTPLDAPIELVVYAPALSFPKGNVALKNLGFSKLVRRDTGVYENVTARDDQTKIVSADTPASGLNLGSSIGD